MRNLISQRRSGSSPRTDNLYMSPYCCTCRANACCGLLSRMYNIGITEHTMSNFVTRISYLLDRKGHDLDRFRVVESNSVSLGSNWLAKVG